MRIYIIRHGETEWNLVKRIQGWKNSDLTEKGVKDAKQLSEKLKNVDFDYIYSSTQMRAVDTANIIKGSREIEITKMEDLREIRLALWEGMTVDEINNKYPEEYDIYLNTPHLYKPVDGESYEDLYDRIKRVFNMIINMQGENILIVTHGVCLKIIIAIIKDIPLKRVNEIPIYPGTALNICEKNKDSLELILEGDTSHMD